MQLLGSLVKDNMQLMLQEILASMVIKIGFYLIEKKCTQYTQILLVRDMAAYVKERIIGWLIIILVMATMIKLIVIMILFMSALLEDFRYLHCIYLGKNIN